MTDWNDTPTTEQGPTGTMQQRAEWARQYFEVGERENGDTYRRCTDNAPEWITELVRAAHGDMLPDDWRYEMIVDCLDVLAECDDEDVEFVEPDPDIYAHELLAWISSHGARQGYVDHYCTEFGTQTVESFADLERIIAGAQWMEKSDVLASVRESLS